MGISVEETQKSSLQQAAYLSFILEKSKVERESEEKIESKKKTKEELFEEEIKEGEEAILEIIHEKVMIKGYTHFNWNEFRNVFDYSINHCSFSQEIQWIEIRKKQSPSLKRISKSIPILFSFFLLLFFLVKKPTFSDLYVHLRLDRFSKAKEHNSKVSFAMKHFYKCVKRFSVGLYDSLVELRARIDIGCYPSLADGRSIDFQYLIRELNDCLFIVDGKNQEIPMEFVADKRENGMDKWMLQKN